MKFGEKYNIHGYKHNGDLYKVWDETIFLAQTDDYNCSIKKYRNILLL